MGKEVVAVKRACGKEKKRKRPLRAALSKATAFRLQITGLTTLWGPGCQIVKENLASGGRRHVSGCLILTRDTPNLTPETRHLKSGG